MYRLDKSDRFKIIFIVFVAFALVTLAIGGVRSAAKAHEDAQKSTDAAARTNHTVETAQAPRRFHSNAPRAAHVVNAAANGKAAASVSAAARAAQKKEKRVEGCVQCHGQIEAMHQYGLDESTGDPVRLTHVRADGTDAQGLTCTACHGGNPVAATAEEAHVKPRYPKEWMRNGKLSSANPERSNTLLLRESWEFVRFVNPGDFRVADRTCATSGCHVQETAYSRTSMMTHGAMLWGAALYNNGGFPIKDTRFGEVYTDSGAPARVVQTPAPTEEQRRLKGILPFLDPVPRWEISQPGNILRVFERGGRRRLEVGLPDKDEEPGLPDKGLSPRGLGTAQRTDPVFLGIQKTRLLDPTLNFLGTNDHPGDYRSSGCSACHVVYANDRNVFHSGHYAQYGNGGATQTDDVSLKEARANQEPGHPIKHQFTSQIPSSNCMVCHMHPGENMVATYFGMMWYDNETDGDKLFPKEQHNPTQEEEAQVYNRNPEGANVRGLWRDVNFLKNTGSLEFNKQLKRTQIADFHGHGWLFRYVFWKDRKGNLLDRSGKPLNPNDPDLFARDEKNPDAFKKVVHLKDIHLEKGMHCIDCHFRQDTHGNGNLYNEPRAAIEIACTDCHGTISKRADELGFRTSGFAAQERKDRSGNIVRGRDLRTITTHDANNQTIPIFEVVKQDTVRKHPNGKEERLKKGDIIQNSLVETGEFWRVVQTRDTIDPDARDYNVLSRYAKTIRRDNKTWGDVPANEKELAHPDGEMACFTCHSSWMTSCFGCHLSMQANRKMPNRHNEGTLSRNFTTYNFQVLRDDVFMLGIDGTTTGHRVAPVASRSAVVVSSQNQNREWIYSTQQTISAEGYSGQAMNTHVPHTVSAGIGTKGCADCHVSKSNDNNAWLAQTYLQGTNFVNYMGQYVYVAATESMEAVRVVEPTDPQAVFGSTLHKIAYPSNYDKFVNRDKRELKTSYEHHGNPEVLQVQLRGEYAYVAAGKGGMRIYDVAQVDHKGFSERITTAPVSPLGQRFYVKSKDCVAVASPTTLGVDPARVRNPANEEQPIHLLYAFLYMADREEGLILVNAATLLDGDPLNNFLERALTFNPEGKLKDATNLVVAGTRIFYTTDHGLYVIDINDPMHPRITAEMPFNKPKAVAIQFRYAFIVDADGLKVVNITNPDQPQLIEKATVPLTDARDVYVARTYAYVANGKEGLAIINVENPEKPKDVVKYNADGALNDTYSVRLAMTNASLFAYVADGRNGMRVLQLLSPETDPNYAGFSPKPNPRLIATYKTKGPAVGISKGLDRDRGVDESGNQLVVFGRRGARPFNERELRRMYILESTGKPFTVTSDAPDDSEARPFKVNKAENESTPLDKTKATAATIGGMSLLLIGFGWRRRRRLRRR
jgi:hypothetical protein